MAHLLSTTLFAMVLAAASAKKLDSGSCSSTVCASKDVALLQTTKQNHLALSTDERRDSVSDSVVVISDDEPALLTIVSYNLYWWNVASNNRWNDLYNRIKDNAPFDLIGFQECEDVSGVLRSVGLDKFDSYQGPTKPQNNPAPLAWNRDLFSTVGGPGNKWVASDQYGGRYLTWVRLNHKPSGVNIFFANTHGPLGNCGTTLGQNWVAGINDNKVAGDIVFVTGDFNCGSGSQAMNAIKGALVDDNLHDIDGGIDQILTDLAVKESGGSVNGWPSDHPMIKGTFRVSSSGGASPSAGQPPSHTDTYRWVGAPQVGGWGGRCRCPSGAIYEVGDNYDACGSLACVGGEVVENCGQGVISAQRDGWKVTCGAPTSIDDSTPAQNVSPKPLPTPSPPPGPKPAPNPPTEGTSTACDLDANAGGHSCGDRIMWLKSPAGGTKSDADARSQVAKEFPSICGACATSGGGSGSTTDKKPAPVPAPTSGKDVSEECTMFVSYNIQYNNAQGLTGPGNAIKHLNADIVGTQETQDKHGLARSSGRTLVEGTDFQNPMYYDSSKVSVISSGWETIPRDNYADRTYTWATFSRGGKTASLFNTHLPHKHGEAGPINAHKMVAEQIAMQAQSMDGCKVIMGDMNPHAGDFKGEISKLGYRLVAESRAQLGGYDQILVSSECGTVSNTGDGPNGGSDHVPVYACIHV